MLCYLHEGRRSSAAAFAAAAFAELGMAAVVLDLTRPVADVRAVARAARREARLLGAGLVAGPVDELGAAVGEFCDPSWPVVLFGRRSWDPLWTAEVPLCLEAPTVPAAEVAAFWTGGRPAGRSWSGSRLRLFELY